MNELPPSPVRRRSELRIAYLSTDAGVPVFGSKGASVHVQGVMKAMTSLGATVDLYSSATAGDRPQGLEGVSVHHLTGWSKARLGTRETVLEANGRLFSTLENAGPFDLVYERYGLWSYAGMQYARFIGAPGALEVNAPLIEEEERYRGHTNRELAEEVAAKAFGEAAHLIAVSSAVAEYLGKFAGGRKKVHVVPNAVDPDRFPDNLPRSRPAKDGTFTVGFLGSLKPWHGLDTLADAFASLHKDAHDTRLLVVGDGPERERFLGLIAQKRLESSCDFVGAVPPSSVPSVVASMDVGVAPYPDLTGFYFSPLKVLEYMAAGKPTVASRVGDLHELIDDGVDGILIPPGNPNALASALKVLMQNPGLRASMGLAARRKVLRSHTWTVTVKRIFEICGIAPSLGDKV